MKGDRVEVEKKEREDIGIWFLPESPDDKLSGSLNIDDKGNCQLKLAENFGGIKGIGSNECVEAILGFLANGKKVTLLNCIQTNQQWGFPGFPVTVYTSTIAIIGEWYNSDEDIVVSEITASYNYLNYWINCKPFSVVKDDEKKEIYMTYCMPKVVTCNVENEKIELTYGANCEGDSYSNFEIHQSEFVCFKFKEKVHYKNAFDRVNDFANFLTLCIGKRISALTVTTVNQEGQEVEFIYPRDTRDNGVVKEHELYIKYTYVKDNFENIMKNWLSKKDMLNPIIDYFVDAHETEFRIPISFLKVVQAIEAYSRRMRKNEIMPPEIFEKKVQSILEKIESEDDKRLVKSILSNEPRLRQRLTELFDETNYVFNISSAKRKSYINKIVNTRNYYTHFDKSLEDKILNPTEMFYLSRLIRSVLRVLLLQELGLSQDLIKIRMQEDQGLVSIKEGLGLIPPAKLFDIKIVPTDKEKPDSPDYKK